jgi:hypothetical protein
MCRRFRESAMGMASLHPAHNLRCRISRRLVSHRRNSILIYPNKPAPSCKTIISPSPVAPYRRLLILHRGRRVVEDLHPPFAATHKLYICIIDTWHTLSLIASSLMFVECSGLVIRSSARSSLHPHHQYLFELIFLSGSKH